MVSPSREDEGPEHPTQWQEGGALAVGEPRAPEHLRRLLESTRIVPWVADARTWTFTYVGAQVIDLLGYPRERWYEEDFWLSHLHPDDQEEAVSYCAKSSQTCREYEFDYRMISATGQTVWLHDIVSVEMVNGAASELRGFLIDITARKQAQEALESVASSLLTVKEDEQRRLARELHDGFNQRLAALSIQLGSIRQRLSNVSPDTRRELAAAQDDVVELAKDLQRVARDLHPSALEHLGLVAALRQHCREVSQRDGITVHFTAQPEDRSVGPEVGLCLYRIAQESLRNVVQHSRSRAAEVTLRSLPDGLYLSIRDSGIGFDANGAGGRGLGLVSLRERVRPFDGTLSIRSERGIGTEIQVHLPRVA